MKTLLDTTKLLLPIFIFLLLLSCQKDTINSVSPPVTTPETKETLEIIWQVPMGVVDTNIYLSNGPAIIKDKIAVGCGKGVQFRNKNSGEFLFLWDDWFGTAFNHSQRVQVLDQNVFVNSQIKTYLIDSQNGQTIWKHIIEHGATYSNITFGNIYHGTRDKSNLFNDFSFLTELDKNTGKRDTIYTVAKVNSYEPGIQPPAGWINSTGDSLLIFLVRSLDFGGTLDEQLDIYAYNLTADSIEWQLIDYDIDGSARVGPPLVEDDMVYISGKNTLYCLNAADGSLVWQHRFEDHTDGFTESLFISAIIKVGNRLVISPTNSNTYCFDAFTGKQLWKKTDSASSPQNMVHHKGIIYTVGQGNGKLFAIDLETGEHYWRENPPNYRRDSRAGFFNEIALDPETGYIYADDRFFVLCIKPYERE